MTRRDEVRNILTPYEQAVLGALFMHGPCRARVIAEEIDTHPNAAGSACHRMYFMPTPRVRRHVNDGNVVTWEAISDA